MIGVCATILLNEIFPNLREGPATVSLDSPRCNGHYQLGKAKRMTDDPSGPEGEPHLQRYPGAARGSIRHNRATPQLT